MRPNSASTHIHDAMQSIGAGSTVSPGAPGSKGHDSYQLLIVDDDDAIREAIADAIRSPQRAIHHAADIHEAGRVMGKVNVDLVLIDVGLPDGDGLQLAADLRRTHPLTRSIIITGTATVDRAVEALRAGAVDFISKPLNIDDLNARIGEALKRQQHDSRREFRLERLRKLCKQLNAARHEITQQVDILCNDLVTAYQELAGQVQHIELTGDLRNTLAGELDLEQTLRRVLEFVIDRVGPTNAVIFLPSQEGDYTAGGYVNYSMGDESLNVILDRMADVVAPALAATDKPVWLSDNESIAEWLGEHFPWLDDCELIGVSCADGAGEVLASLIIFRNNAQPYEAGHHELLTALGPMLAEHLERVIRIHHRHKDLFGDDDDNDLDSDSGGGLLA